MGWEYEGLFDAIPGNSDLLAGYWQSEGTAIRIGKMGYRTRTIKAGTRLEAEVYPVFGRSQEREARAARLNMTRERQAQLNTRRAKRQLVLLVENNFRMGEDVAVTLTYGPGREPTDMKRCRKDIRNFLGRVKRLRGKRGLAEMKYIYAIGHDQQQRTHVHLLMTGGIERGELERIWGKGYANTYRLQEYGSGLQGIAGYLYRQNEKARDRGERIGYHMWSGSRNLKKPREHVSDSKLSNKRIRAMALYFPNEAKQIMEKVYPGYVLESGEVRFSDVVDGVYIYCVMRKVEDDDQGRKTRAGRADADEAGAEPAGAAGAVYAERGAAQHRRPADAGVRAGRMLPAGAGGTGEAEL